MESGSKKVAKNEDALRMDSAAVKLLWKTQKILRLIRASEYYNSVSDLPPYLFQQ